jgi:hypothetical protein
LVTGWTRRRRGHPGRWSLDGQWRRRWFGRRRRRWFASRVFGVGGLAGWGRVGGDKIGMWEGMMGWNLAGWVQKNLGGGNQFFWLICMIKKINWFGILIIKWYINITLVLIIL